MEEALALRAAGDTGPVLTWLAVAGGGLPARACAADVDVTAYTVDELAEIVAAARAVGRSPGCSSRSTPGCPAAAAAPSEWADLVRRAAAQAQDDGDVRVTGVWSHLACADEPDHPANDDQEQVFRDACDVAAAAGLTPRGAPPGQLRGHRAAARPPASTWSAAASPPTG